MKVDDGLDTDGRIQAVGNEITGIFIRAASYCSRNLTDGIVPDSWVTREVSRQRSRRERIVGKLVAEGLWERVEGGYCVVPLHDDSDRLLETWTKERAKAWRRKEAARKRAQRERTEAREATDAEAEISAGSIPSRNPVATSPDSSSDLDPSNIPSKAAKGAAVPGGHHKPSRTPIGQDRTGIQGSSNVGVVRDSWMRPDDLSPELRVEREAELRDHSSSDGDDELPKAGS